MRGIVYAASPLTLVIMPGSLWQYGLTGAISGSTSRTSQLSITVLPLLRPPCSVSPLRGRARHVDLNAVVDLILLAEVAGVGEQVVGLAEERRRHVVQIRQHVAAAVRQPRIARRRDAEPIELRRGDAAIVVGR